MSGKIKNEYDLFAKRYNAVFSSLKSRRREYDFVLREIPEKTNSLLDLGCGNGILLKALAPRVGQASGLDSSAGMAGYARKNTAGCENIRIFHHADAALPFPDKTFDCVVSVFSLRHLPLAAALPEIRRVLKDRGKLIVADQFSRAGKRPRLFDLLKSKLRFLSFCLLHPYFYPRLLRLVSLPEWKTMARRFPGKTVEEVLKSVRRQFCIGTVQRINESLRRITCGFTAFRLS